VLLLTFRERSTNRKRVNLWNVSTISQLGYIPTTLFLNLFIFLSSLAQLKSMKFFQYIFVSLLQTSSLIGGKEDILLVATYFFGHNWCAAAITRADSALTKFCFFAIKKAKTYLLLAGVSTPAPAQH
jgi:hypothetical protein